MPTPKSLASDVSAAEIAAAANAARARHNADVAEKGGSEADQPPPGEGWSASSWLREQRVSDIVGRVLMRPLADLETGAAFAGASVYPGSVELHFCRALGAKGSRMALLRLLREGDVIETLVDALWPKLEALASTGAATATELHNKFVDEGAGFDLEYAGLKSFFSGLEAVVGAPTPQVYMGMKRDHCDCEDSVIPFDTPNYKMTTTSRIEWCAWRTRLWNSRRQVTELWATEARADLRGSSWPFLASSERQSGRVLARVHRGRGF